MKPSSNHNFIHYLVTVLATLVKSLVRAFVWLGLASAGYLVFRTKKTPINLIIGLPLIIGGTGMVINYLWSFFLSLFSPKYNQGVCKFCSKVSDSSE